MNTDKYAAGVFDFELCKILLFASFDERSAFDPSYSLRSTNCKQTVQSFAAVKTYRVAESTLVYFIRTRFSNARVFIIVHRSVYNTRTRSRQSSRRLVRVKELLFSYRTVRAFRLRISAIRPLFGSARHEIHQSIRYLFVTFNHQMGFSRAVRDRIHTSPSPVMINRVFS